MTVPDLSRLAATALRRNHQGERTSRLSRERGVAVIAESMRRRHRRRAIVRYAVMVGTLASAAAAGALVRGDFVGGVGANSPPAVAQSNATAPCAASGRCASDHGDDFDAAVVNGDTFQPGSRFEAHAGEPKLLRLASGTQVLLDGESALLYDEGGKVHRFRVTRGHAEFSVVKQQPDERFLVDAADCQIEVHGTVFEVALSDDANGCGQRTSVGVSEGIVEIRAKGEQVFVTAGNRWPGPCEVPARQSARHENARHESTRHESTRHESVSRPSARPHGEPGEARPAIAMDGSARHEQSVAGLTTPASSADAVASELRRQNEIYAQATRAMQQGRYDEAARIYERLNREFPNGPLAESAALARARAVSLARGMRTDQ